LLFIGFGHYVHLDSKKKQEAHLSECASC